MKAIVLTCDRYRTVTEHMICCYDEQWPGHPFRFRIPWQERAGVSTANREYVRTPRPIKATVLELLTGLDSNEWIYWCIDDKYPVLFDLPRVRAILDWIGRDPLPGISGILFCRCRLLLKQEYLTGRQVHDTAGYVYLERRGYEQIWIHQFLRVAVLRHLFEAFPDDIPSAIAMDELKRRVDKPRGDALFVTRESHAVFGESTTGGALTVNCRESIRSHGMRLPEWDSGEGGRTIRIGEDTFRHVTDAGI